MKQRLSLIRFLCVILCFICCGLAIYGNFFATVSAMPFYDLQPKELTLRASFYTSYPASTEERKNNIKLASKSLDNVFVDSNSEFSFNDTVGDRTIERGYKTSKIIFGGQFVDGVGGGVCQVSTTLYNAVLLAGLPITEYHPHSLAVSYVAPSFDAMVNSGSADLRFINNTHNPIIIRSFADDSTIKIEIYGEPMVEKYTRISTVKSEIPAPDYKIVYDEEGLYPDLIKGERKIITFAKNGYISQGSLVKMINGKMVSSKIIRNDIYKPLQGVAIEGIKEPLEDKNTLTLPN